MDGGPWLLFGEQHWINPKAKVPDWCWDVVRLWRQYQGGMGGVGHLPEGGGTMDQSPVVLDAFAAMSAAEAELKPEG